MIVPTRFGLKYAPIPTLALEYQDDMHGVVDATGESCTSLYVYRDGSEVPRLGPRRKLHIVELPMLTRTSETQEITRQLQQDNGRFLSPGVVNESQLKRLLDRLVQNLPTSAPSDEDAVVMREEEGEALELDESTMNVKEESVDSKLHQGALASHEEREEERLETFKTSTFQTTKEAAAMLDQKEQGEDQDGADVYVSPVVLPTKGEEERDKAQQDEDVEKLKALQSEVDVSEEEVQSEELEYFSEDGSDEDSF